MGLYLTFNITSFPTEQLERGSSVKTRLKGEKKCFRVLEKQAFQLAITAIPIAAVTAHRGRVSNHGRAIPCCDIALSTTLVHMAM